VPDLSPASIGSGGAPQPGERSWTVALKIYLRNADSISAAGVQGEQQAVCGHDGPLVIGFPV
jgi:hypothetical protein